MKGLKRMGRRRKVGCFFNGSFFEQPVLRPLFFKKRRDWSEEDLKMKFASHILDLSGLVEDDKGFVSFFDKKLEATVDGHDLSVKADFVMAKGVLDYMEEPFFHFQEYKPQKKPTGDPMAQLLEAFLIAQVKNKRERPLYGCEVNGANWRFVVMEGRTYCVSAIYDASRAEELRTIVGILRKFKRILLV